MSNAMLEYRKCIKKLRYYARKESYFERLVSAGLNGSVGTKKRLLKSLRFWQRMRRTWGLHALEAYSLLSLDEKYMLLMRDTVCDARTKSSEAKHVGTTCGGPDAVIAKEMVAQIPLCEPKTVFEEYTGAHLDGLGQGNVCVCVEESYIDSPGKCALKLEVLDHSFEIHLTNSEIWALLEFVSNSSMWTRKHNRGLSSYVVGSTFKGIIFYWNENGELFGKTFGEKASPEFVDRGFMIEDRIKFHDSLQAARQLVSCTDTYGFDGAKISNLFDRWSLEVSENGTVSYTIGVSLGLTRPGNDTLWLELDKKGVTNVPVVFGFDYASAKALIGRFASYNLVLNYDCEVSLKRRDREGWEAKFVMPKNRGRVKITTGSGTGEEWLVEYIDADVMKALYDLLMRGLFVWQH